MDITSMLQRSIDYIENHIKDDINYKDAAMHVNLSNYYFHRMFSMIVGISANEYIRNRRLSLAGEEVIMTNRKIIDIALDYGYETPESFSKAFLRFHGISPIVARRSGGNLKMFNYLQIKIIFKGGTKMNYRIERLKPFTLISKTRQFSNETINQEGNNAIPDFWEESIKAGIFDDLSIHSNEPARYGVCGPIDKTSNTFRYGIAMEYDSGDVDDHLELWEVKPELWAVFECIGDSPECIGETWNKVFTEFLPGSEYSMLDDTDFEKYPYNPKDGLYCEIWIPIRKD